MLPTRSSGASLPAVSTVFLFLLFLLRLLKCGSHVSLSGCPLEMSSDPVCAHRLITDTGARPPFLGMQWGKEGRQSAWQVHLEGALENGWRSRE